MDIVDFNGLPDGQSIANSGHYWGTYGNGYDSQGNTSDVTAKWVDPNIISPSQTWTPSSANGGKWVIFTAFFLL